MRTTTRLSLVICSSLLLSVGCRGDAGAPLGPDIAGPLFLAVPQVLPEGVAFGAGSEINSGGVATAAALFNQPSLWGIEMTGAEVFIDASEIDIPAMVTRLDEVNPDLVNFVDSNEAQFTVPWASHGISGGSSILMCVQLVLFTDGGEKLLGEPACELYGPFGF